MEDLLKFYHNRDLKIDVNEDTLEMTITETIRGCDLIEELYINDQVLENDDLILFPDKDENGELKLYKIKKEKENE